MAKAAAISVERSFIFYLPVIFPSATIRNMSGMSTAIDYGRAKHAIYTSS
jgi:hypothetical protein